MFLGSADRISPPLEPVIAEHAETARTIPVADLTAEFVRDAVDFAPAESRKRIAGTFIGNRVAWSGRVYSCDPMPNHRASILVCGRYASFSTTIDIAKPALRSSVAGEPMAPLEGYLLQVDGIIEGIDPAVIRLKDAITSPIAEDYGRPSEYQRPQDSLDPATRP
jgi:hypothetical protein